MPTAVSVVVASAQLHACSACSGACSSPIGGACSIPGGAGAVADFGGGASRCSLAASVACRPGGSASRLGVPTSHLGWEHHAPASCANQAAAADRVAQVGAWVSLGRGRGTIGHGARRLTAKALDESMPCRRCLNERELRESHIVPEFLHTPLYDAKHRVELVTHGAQRPRTLQKGLRERLLCGECEGVFNKYERYFSQYWYHSGRIPKVVPSGGILLRDLDYRLAKLFFISIIWRASVASRHEFRAAQLGPHEDKFRGLLLAEDPGPPDVYPVCGGLLVEPSTQEIRDELVFEPLRFRQHGLWCYRLVFAGASWTVLIPRHKQVPGLREHCLNEEGELRLPAMSWQEFARVGGVAAIVKSIASGVPV